MRLSPIIKTVQICLFISIALFSSTGQTQEIDTELRAVLKETINSADSFQDRFDAEVWLVDMSQRLKRYIADDKERLELLKAIHKAAVKAGLKPELVLSVIQIESAFKPFALSYVGAQGLMQVMPFWKNEIGRPDDNLMNRDTNLRYGCTILSYYIKKEKGDLIRGLARYNGSLGKTKYPEKVLLAWERRWFMNN